MIWICRFRFRKDLTLISDAVTNILHIIPTGRPSPTAPVLPKDNEYPSNRQVHIFPGSERTYRFTPVLYLTRNDPNRKMQFQPFLGGLP
jgi:hypothetical protein